MQTARSNPFVRLLHCSAGGVFICAAVLYRQGLAGFVQELPWLAAAWVVSAGLLGLALVLCGSLDFSESDRFRVGRRMLGCPAWAVLLLCMLLGAGLGFGARRTVEGLLPQPGPKLRLFGQIGMLMTSVDAPAISVPLFDKQRKHVRTLVLTYDAPKLLPLGFVRPWEQREVDEYVVSLKGNVPRGTLIDVGPYRDARSEVVQAEAWRVIGGNGQIVAGSYRAWRSDLVLHNGLVAMSFGLCVVAFAAFGRMWVLSAQELYDARRRAGQCPRCKFVGGHLGQCAECGHVSSRVVPEGCTYRQPREDPNAPQSDAA